MTAPYYDCLTFASMWDDFLNQKNDCDGGKTQAAGALLGPLHSAWPLTGGDRVP